jgi:predicted aspartyl protease
MTITMGKVLTTLTIINAADQIRAKDGSILLEEVRSLTLENVLVDTGAITLCLPSAAITALGLELLKEVDVSTANGISKARIF